MSINRLFCVICNLKSASFRYYLLPPEQLKVLHTLPSFPLPEHVSSESDRQSLYLEQFGVYTGCPVKLSTPVFKSNLCLSCNSDLQMEYLLFLVDKNRCKKWSYT